MHSEFKRKLKKLQRGTTRQLRSQLRRLSSGRPPGFIIIGAQKAGTTTLFKTLNRHPALEGSQIKEINHFNHRMHFGAQRIDYEKNFSPLPFSSPIFFEATPEYLAYPGVASRIASYYPSIKLICILREPVSRAYSAYNMYKKQFEAGYLQRLRKESERLPGDRLMELQEKEGKILPFRACIEFELDLMRSMEGTIEPALVRRGLYLQQIKNYWEVFGRDSLLILGFSDLKQKPQFVFDQVCDFIGVPRHDLKDTVIASNVGRYPSNIPTSDKELLSEFYQKPNDALFDAIGAINW